MFNRKKDVTPMGERARRIVERVSNPTHVLPEVAEPTELFSSKTPVEAPVEAPPVEAPVDTVVNTVVNTVVEAPKPVEKMVSRTVMAAKEKLQKKFMDLVNTSEVSKLTREEAVVQLADLVTDVLKDNNVILNAVEQKELVKLFTDDMFGLGPLEPLLQDPTITDIMVNAPDEVYVERNGLLEKAGVSFDSKEHIHNIAQRIVNSVGRRVDESSPMVDARLADGSRVNITLPPLSFKSPTISIRKFAKDVISLDQMVEQGNLSKDMAMFLKLATRAKLNILISGGTGSGKTTLLNAMSESIPSTERIITIEDAAELRLEQPHVVTLESRPANLEGQGQISIRDLLVNSLRMRPDRIIIGEVRGGEVVDMLQAMNTGHDGSLGTVHANNPRDTLVRLENLFFMSGMNLPSASIRTLISSAVQLIVQISRMADGKRRVTSITELAGMEGDVITAQELYKFNQTPTRGFEVFGEFESTGIRTIHATKIENAGFGNQISELLR